MPFPHDLPLTLAQSPCKDCTERVPLRCHSTCEKYAAFRAECEALAAERHNARELNEYLGDVIKRMPGQRNL